MNSPARKNVRLYLDVDGVLNAHALMWGDTAPLAVVVSMGGGYATKYTINHSPRMLAAIDRLRDEFDFELVWLTTWLEDGAISGLVEKLGALRNGRWLSIPRRTGRVGYLPQTWKREQILADLAGEPVPFIWADDNEVPIHGAFVSTAFEVPSLMIAPDQELGLTPEHLVLMRNFLVANS